jgi:hypothetical protein
VTALAELCVVSAIYGVAATIVFRRFTNALYLRGTINRILAHVMEFGLFLDEPRIILRAQRDLIAENIRLLRQIALPCVILAIPFGLLYGSLDRHFGYGPLRIGERAVATARGITEWKAPAGIVVETSGVRVLRTGEISWRVRPVATVYGSFPKGVDVRYPPAVVLHMPWMIWFFGVSALTAMFPVRFLRVGSPLLLFLN